MLTVVRDDTGPVPVLRPVGTLSLDSAASMRTELHKALVDEPLALVVDLVGAAVDDASLTVFGAFARYAASRSGTRLLICASDTTRDALVRLGVNRLVRIYPDPAAALAAVAAERAPLRYVKSLPTTTDAGAIARELVATACREWRLAAEAEPLTVVVHELVANAVVHAGGDIWMQLLLGRHLLHVAVHDGSTAPPVLGAPALHDERGRGLVIVEALTVRWGSTPGRDGKTVWAALRRDPPGRETT